MKTLKRQVGEKLDQHHIRTRHGKIGLYSFWGKLRRDMQEDHVNAFAASLTYNLLFALFPFLLLLLSVLGLVHATNFLRDALDSVAYALPSDLNSLLAEQITSLTTSHNAGALSLTATVGTILALWGTSGAVRAIMEAMNVMYRIKENRSFIRRYLTSFVLSILVVALFILALVLVVAGPSIAHTVLGSAAWVWEILQWPLLVLVVMIAYGVLYALAPAGHKRFRPFGIGARFASLAWVCFSLAFSLYVNTLGSYDAKYGALAGIIVALLYLYYVSLIALIGAEIESIWEKL